MRKGRGNPPIPPYARRPLLAPSVTVWVFPELGHTGGAIDLATTAVLDSKRVLMVVAAKHVRKLAARPSPSELRLAGWLTGQTALSDGIKRLPSKTGFVAELICPATVAPDLSNRSRSRSNPEFDAISRIPSIQGGAATFSLVFCPHDQFIAVRAVRTH
jgi:hypothetical protein